MNAVTQCPASVTQCGLHRLTNRRSIRGGISAEESAGVVAVDIDALEPNPLQPRSTWDDENLGELAASIREHGIIQPLIVTTASGAVPYQIIAGERRWRAARLAGLSSIPVLVREVTTAEALELALVENVQRADLNAIEEAIAFRHLNDEFGLTQEQIDRFLATSVYRPTCRLRKPAQQPNRLGRVG